MINIFTTTSLVSSLIKINNKMKVDVDKKLAGERKKLHINSPSFASYSKAIFQNVYAGTGKFLFFLFFLFSK